MCPRANFDQISFCKILTNKYHHVYVQAESFHLNGHIIGFGPQTQKLKPPYKTPSNALAVKGLNVTKITNFYRYEIKNEMNSGALTIYTNDPDGNLLHKHKTIKILR